MYIYYSINEVFSVLTFQIG